MFSSLRFRHPFRKYQTMILDLVASKPADRKFHIVAPPGAGKTIVGLELIGRFDQPAVVFAPTSTIQSQWIDKVGLFVTAPDRADDFAGDDPRALKPINVFTYQLLSTPGENQDFLRELAEAAWVSALVAEGKADDEAAARARIATLQLNNPDAHAAELRKRAARAKREAIRDPQFDGARFLHPNARALIERLAGFGVQTVVLDECHHLLDYWAIVIKELIKRLGNPRVIGLTATLPALDDEDEYKNYSDLLGEVDFEVPTPAVVKEGNLAPYRDLVYFCQPTGRELEYLRNVQAAFERALQAIIASPRFGQWVESLLLHPSPESWVKFLDEHPALAIAGVKFLRLRSDLTPRPPSLKGKGETMAITPPSLPASGREGGRGDERGPIIPDNYLLLDEMDAPMALDDWAALLEPFGLNVLKVSGDSKDHALLDDLEQSLMPFGLSLTERGLRQQRAPGDLVLALSESKDAAVVKILQTEHEALGERLRAIVITDFEKLSASARRLKGVIDPDAGSAVRAFRALVADARLNALDPILVTGTTVLVDADHGEALLRYLRDWLKAAGFAATISYQPTDDPKVLELVGRGQGWSSRVYVQMLTKIFEQGRTQCLVGTRGIFGEGWDALTLNTLIDLTAVTTSTGVNQLRGRSIRLDPGWPRKAAHNWDVVCVTKEFERGDADLKRFTRKHAHYWGLVHLGRWEQMASDANQVIAGLNLAVETRGEIRKGVAHVDNALAFDLASRDFRKINFEKYNRRMLLFAATGARDATYQLWGVGEPYSNFSYSATQLETTELKFVTAHTVTETLKGILRQFIASFVASLMWIVAVGLQALRVGLTGGVLGVLLSCVTVVLFVAPVVVIAVNARSAYRLFKKALLDLPPDAVLLDVGRALLAALRDAGLVSRNLSDNFVRVHETGENTYEVFIDYASPEDSDTFARAYRQIFAPLREQRYLIKRDVSSLPQTFFQPLWLFLRSLVRRAGADDAVYHPVPDVLGAKKNLAERFAEHWRRTVGGGELIFVKTEAGRKILLQARAKQKRKVKQMAFEIWR